MVDEIDKVDIKCQHAFLHVSDASDNHAFMDGYLSNFTHDLSHVLFIFNMNSEKELDPALLDRLDIIHCPEYSNEEKIQIFKNYMLPKALMNLGMKRNDIVVLDSAIKKLLEDKKYSLRNLEMLIKDIVSKVNMYKSILLPDGSLGELQFDYEIPNFKLPLKIDYKLLSDLIN